MNIKNLNNLEDYEEGDTIIGKIVSDEGDENNCRFEGVSLTKRGEKTFAATMAAGVLTLTAAACIGLTKGYERIRETIKKQKTLRAKAKDYDNMSERLSKLEKDFNQLKNNKGSK